MAALTVEEQLCEILAEILSQNEDARILSANELESTCKLSELGVNSVDMMEFVLCIEHKFDVDLLGNLLPNELPDTIVAWAGFVQDLQSIE